MHTSPITMPNYAQERSPRCLPAEAKEQAGSTRGTTATARARCRAVPTSRYVGYPLVDAGAVGT